MNKSKEKIIKVAGKTPSGADCVMWYAPYNPSHTVKLDEDIDKRLYDLAEALGRSRHGLMVEAIKRLLDFEENALRDRNITISRKKHDNGRFIIEF